MARTETMLISITKEQYQRLKAIADKEDRSMGAVLSRMMDLYQKQNDEK